MSFTSIAYGMFLLLVGAIYWSVPRQNWRLWTVLIASLAFYGQPQYIPLLLAIAFINFALGRWMEYRGSGGSYGSESENEAFTKLDWDWGRTVLLILGIILNVLLLLGFKYLSFLNSLLQAILNMPLPLERVNSIADNLIAPLGLSFFCFESIAYLIDVYRGAPAAGQFLPFAAYKLFFPKLISGPITTYHQFDSQWDSLRFPNAQLVAEALWSIAFGAAKKLLLADRLGLFVTLCFDNLVRAGSGDLWLATFAYGLQLYLDFSAYVDIVRGSAILFGLHLPDNFDYPYFSTSIADFWRRWHISLGDWLRNYLYFPLGGSRRGLARTCLNLLIVMAIAGIWHGAAWGFIVWGLLHGIALVLHRITEAISGPKSFWHGFPGVIFAWALTQATVFTAWIFFRLPNLPDSGWVLQHLWGYTADIQFAQKVYLDSMGLDRLQFAMVLGLLFLGMFCLFVLHRLLNLQLNWPLKLLLVPFCLYTVWHLAPQGGLPYIYFDF